MTDCRARGRDRCLIRKAVVVAVCRFVKQSWCRETGVEIAVPGTVFKVTGWAVSGVSGRFDLWT